MLLQDRQCHKQVEATGLVIRPETLPQPQDIHPRKFAFVPDQQHPEEEEEICAVGLFQMLPQLRVHEVHQLVKRCQLRAHAGLVTQEVSFHTLHKVLEGPEGDSIVLYDSVDGCQQIRHALHVAQFPVVLIVREEQVLHFFHVRVGANLGKGRVWVWVRNVFAHEDRNVAIGAVDVFLCLDCEHAGLN